MTNYSDSNPVPWEARKQEIISVVFDDTVTSIGSCAFQECKNIASIDFPSGLKSIGDYAFDFSDITGDLVLPEGLESIGSCAFRAVKISSLTIPSTVTSIGSQAFNQSDAATVVFAEGIELEEISDWIFANMRKMNTIAIPEGVTVIRESAFISSTNLTSIDLPASLTEIEARAFGSCNKFTEVRFGGTKAQAQAIRVGANNGNIGTARWYCKDGESDGIGATSGTCGSNVTWGLSGTELTISGEGEMAEFTDLNPAPWTAFKEDITSLVVGEGVTTVSRGAFKGMTQLRTLGLPLSLESIGEDATAGDSALEEVDYAGSEEMAKMLPIGDGNEWLVRAHWHYRMDNEGNLESAVYWELNGTALRIYGSGRMPDYNTSFSVPWHASMDRITSVTVEDGVINIGSYLFYGCTALESVSIAPSVATIGDYAFYGCTALESIVIPSGVATIGNDAFASCTSLSSVTLPDRQMTIGDYAFNGCRALTGITLPSHLTRIGYGMLQNTGLTGIVIPAGVKTVRESAFRNCGALASVSLPAGLDTIEYSAFSGTAVTVVVYGGDLADEACINLATGNDTLTTASWQCHDGTGDYPLARSGVLTTGLAWELDNNGTLTVSGTGVVPDYTDANPAPWYYLRGDVTEIVIGTGVRSVGEAAFRRTAGLQAVTLPEGLLAIRESAFYGCSSLQAVTLPSTLLYLAESAFTGCPAKSSVNWDYDNLNDLYPEYEGNENSVAWSLENGVLTLSGRGTMEGGDRPWYSRREEITSIVIQDGITGIWDGAFRNCVNAVSVTIPDSVSFIGSGAFQGCTGLQSVSFGGTEASARKLVIGLNNGPLINAAWSWSGYTGSYPAESSGILSPDFEWRLDFNGTLIVSGDGAMPDCNDSFHAPWNKYSSQIRTLIIEEGMKTIGAYAFTDFSNLTSVTIPASVTNIGEGAFRNNTKLVSLVIPDTVVKIGGYTFDGCSLLSDLTLSASLTEIPYGMCRYCYALESVTIPDGVKRIGGEAFWECRNLEEISLPASLKTVGSSAFQGCTKLADVEFRGTEAQAAGIRIGTRNEKLTGAAWAIQGMSGTDYPVTTGGQLTDTMSWTLTGDTLTISGSGAMPGYEYEQPAPWLNLSSRIRKVTVGSGVTHIGTYAFYRLTNVTEVTIPNTVVRIGYNAFAYTTGLTAVTIPASVRSIGQCAFQGSGLTSVTIPDTVTTMEWGAFCNCTSLTAVTLGTGLRELDSDVFWDCQKLTEVTIPDGVTIIGSDAFGACYKLASVSLPESVTTIEYGAFRSTVVADVTWRGARAKAASVAIGSNNGKLTSAAWHFNDSDSEEYPAATGGALTTTIQWSIEDGVLTISGRGAMPSAGDTASAPWQACAGNIRKVIVDSGIRAVGSNSFRNLAELTEAELAGTVTGIGSYAFYGTGKLKSIALPAGLTTIGEYAFRQSGLESISLPDSVTSMGYGVFEACYSLAEVKLSAGTARIPDNAFWDNDKLERIVIPEGVTAIGYCAFRYCDRLEYVELPASLVFIEESAFGSCGRLARVRYNDTEDQAFYLEIDTGNAPLLDAVWQYKPVDPIIGLTSVLRLPAGLKVIDAEAFAGTGAEAVVIPDGVESIGNGAFAGSATLYVRIPESVKSIGDGAIPQGVTVVCEEDGEIESWCEENEVLHISLWN